MNSIESLILLGFCGAVGGISLIAAMSIRFRYAALVIGVMFFLASISPILDFYKSVYHTWLLPLQLHRAELFGAAGLVLLAGSLIHYRRLSLLRVPVHGWILLLMGVYAGLLRMYHASVDDGAATIVLAAATIFPLSLVTPAILQTRSDCERLLKVIVWAWFAWTLGAGVQFVINRKLVVLGLEPHFTGLISTPNQAATIMAAVAAVSLWLGINGPARMRIVYIGLTGLFGVLLVWTGSRGGAGMFILATAAVLYGRLGRGILLLPVFAIAGYLALAASEAAGISVWTGKLVRTTNTRAGVWHAMYETALSNPLLGAGTTEAGGSENSYLVAFSSYGIVMFLLILCLLGVGIAHSARLYLSRRRIDPADRPLLDLCIGQQVAFFAGGVVEGFIVGRVGANMVLVLIFTAMGRMLLRNARLAAGAVGASDDDGISATGEDGDPTLPDADTDPPLLGAAAG